MKKLLLLLIIPLLSFGQCEDPSACNYDLSSEYLEILPYSNLECEYVGQSCLTDGPNGWYSINFYTWNDNCECAPPEGCLDSSACNYGQSFEGFVVSDGSGGMVLLGFYETPPFCTNPGDSCNIFYENSVEPAVFYNNGEISYGYSGVFNSNCECICTNPENIYDLDFSSGGNIAITSFDECPQFGCTDTSACNYETSADFDDDSCYYPDLCGNCDPSDECGCSELTYVPDDSFENYIEANYPDADNGIENDNYVITSGLNLNGMAGLNITGVDLNAPIYDFTGIENFRNINNVCIAGPSILASSIDLSCITLYNYPYSGSFQLPNLTISNCSFVENIILPSDTFNLEIVENQQLNELIFQDGGIYNSISIGYAASTACYYLGAIGGDDMYMNNSLCDLNLKGGASEEGFTLSIYFNNAMSINLSEFNSTYNISANIVGTGTMVYQTPQNSQIQFGENVVNWTSVNLLGDFPCVEVDNINYCELIWNNESYGVNYSNSCWNEDWNDCNSNTFLTEKSKYSRSKIYKSDILGRENTNKGFQLHIYDDGSVEKKYLIK